VSGPTYGMLHGRGDQHAVEHDRLALCKMSYREIDRRLGLVRPVLVRPRLGDLCVADTRSRTFRFPMLHERAALAVAHGVLLGTSGKRDDLLLKRGCFSS
jgi:hypothetical protein